MSKVVHIYLYIYDPFLVIEILKKNVVNFNRMGECRFFHLKTCLFSPSFLGDRTKNDSCIKKVALHSRVSRRQVHGDWVELTCGIFVLHLPSSF
jgi:hypothetical protein